MAHCQLQKRAGATAAPLDDARAAEIAHDLESLRVLAARFRRLAPTVQGHLLRAILGKREALLASIERGVQALPSVRFGGLEEYAGPPDTDTRNAGFARVLGEIKDLDRESAHVLRERAAATADEIHKLRAGKKWRQSNS